VAITRAEESLTISYALSRFKHGTLLSCEPSRFIQDMDPKMLEMVGVSLPNFEVNNERSWTNTAAPARTAATIRRPAPTVQAQQNAAVKLTPDAEFVADDTTDLQIGNQVEHLRFGVGKVISLEGKHPDTKATIFFQGLGQKQILLKFAKIKIID